MAAYVIVRVEISDWVQYEKYTERTPATIAKFSGRFLARGGESVTLEGPDETRRVVILEFPSLQQAKAWYTSDDYQTVKTLRVGAAQGELLVVNGV
jgi:uncharacterized protein (DUF1330 family)